MVVGAFQRQRDEGKSANACHVIAGPVGVQPHSGQAVNGTNLNRNLKLTMSLFWRGGGGLLLLRGGHKANLCTHNGERLPPPPLQLAHTAHAAYYHR